jgi:hypothetical protein
MNEEQFIAIADKISLTHRGAVPFGTILRAVKRAAVGENNPDNVFEIALDDLNDTPEEDYRDGWD